MIKHYISTMTDDFQTKIMVSVFGTLITALTGFYGAVLWGFLGLFIADLLTGIMKSIHKGIKITSKRLRDSVVKLGSYMILITALIITSKYETSFAPVVTIAYYYFMFTELKSIIENVQEMGVKIPTFIMSSVNEKIEKYDKDEKSK